MKKIFNLFNLLVVAFVVFGALTQAQAQDEIPNEPPRGENRRGERRPDLFRELGLTREQMQQIRQFNISRSPSMQQAQQRLREAMRNLDQAIYADVVNEGEIQTLLKSLQDAQAEIARLRAASELEVRKILTAEQIIKFRELRRRFAEMRKKPDSPRHDLKPDGSKNRYQRRFNRQLRKIPNN